MAYTANKKINALDTATVPLGDTDAVPMVRSGVTYQTSLSAIESKVFSSKTALTSAPSGTEAVVIRQNDGSLKQTTTANLIPDGSVTNTQIGASAGIIDTKLATISSTGKVLNSATTATNNNTASAIVARDASGNFSAGTITAAGFSGPLTGAVTGNATTSTTATNLAVGAAGTVPYQSAAGTTAMLTAGTAGQVLQSNGAAAPSWITPTNANTANTIVKRDGTGNFSAQTITAIGFSGPLTGNVTGTVNGDVTGALTGNAATASKLFTARTIAITGDIAASGTFDGSSNLSIASTLGAGVIDNTNIATAAGIVDTKLATISTALKVSNSATTANSSNVANSIVARDASGNFTAGTVTLAGNLIPAWKLKGAAYTALPGDLVGASTTSGAWTLTLPANPTAGMMVTVYDMGGDWFTKNLTIARNGSGTVATIDGLAQNLVCDVSNKIVVMLYSGTTWTINL
jgi:hypothetical protein